MRSRALAFLILAASAGAVHAVDPVLDSPGPSVAPPKPSKAKKKRAVPPEPARPEPVRTESVRAEWDALVARHGKAMDPIGALVAMIDGYEQSGDPEGLPQLPGMYSQLGSAAAQVLAGLRTERPRTEPVRRYVEMYSAALGRLRSASGRRAGLSRSAGAPPLDPASLTEFRAAKDQLDRSMACYNESIRPYLDP